MLGTEATVKREYTRAHPGFRPGLRRRPSSARPIASIAEAALHEKPVDDADIAREIAPCFVDRTAAAPTPSCCLYPLPAAARELPAADAVAGRLDRSFPAIARRVGGLVGAPARGTTGTARAVFTAGARPSAVLAAALERFGLRDAVQAAG